MTNFKSEVEQNILALGASEEIQKKGISFVCESAVYKYSYNFTWMGRPVIQYPQDMIAMQELIWDISPDIIIETGIAHGGSLIFYASLLELLSISGRGDGMVLGIDVDIREHNRKEIEAHPMFKRIEMIQGSSIDDEVIEKVKKIVEGSGKVMIILDSNHTHDHVLAELEAYAPLTTVGSYCVVFDTVVEDMPPDFFPNRPWGPGNNPKTAVWQYLETHQDFVVDKSIQDKLLITVAPDGYLKRIK